jgi:uroporphyrin-III C-methyltransferase
MTLQNRIGKVYLVGAGPGDPSLLTVKAAELLRQADCVVYDHLVNPEILDYAPPYAELIYAGKQGHKCAMRQESINAILVTKACEYAVVVRLKGGDPFVFGRGGEEAEALVSAGIEWEVVPGVSAGAAVAAYAGIPITHRGLSSSVTFVTGHEDPLKSHSALHWEHLAQGVDTLVFFMGIANSQKIAARLMEHGRASNTPVAIIRWGTYQKQETYISTLAEMATLVERAGITAPAIIVIGEVVNLHAKLNWFMPALMTTPATV